MDILKDFKQFKKELKTHLTEKGWKKIKVRLNGEEAEVIIPHQAREWNFKLSAPEFYARRAAQSVRAFLRKSE